MTSLTDRRDTSDTGDLVLRKFKYQYGYAVILAIRMIAVPSWKCSAIWCEQLEDILVEFNDGSFDAYQVKTKKAENGAWKISDEAFVKSIKRFIVQNKKHSEKINAFKFVSNAEFSNSSSAQSRHLSPLKMMEAVRSVNSFGELKDDAEKGFMLLKEKIGSSSEELFDVLKKLDLVTGPTERAFEDEIAQRHIPTIPIAKSCSSRTLAKITGILIQAVSEASTLSTDKPSRDWAGLTSSLADDPYLISKRITPDIVDLCLKEALNSRHIYPESLLTLELNKAPFKLSILEKKMMAGGLATHYEVMRRRSIAAEQYLLDQSSRPDSDSGRSVLSQIENVVLGECDEANLRASSEKEDFGPSMLIQVQDRLKLIAKDHGSNIHGTPYDVLVGVSGLLSSECKVWWSKKFDLDDME